MLLFSTDKKRLKKHFDNDVVLFGYHLGDLDDFFFPHCQWAVWQKPQQTKIEETILTYYGGDTPTVLAFGLTGEFDRFLEQMLDLFPPKFQGHFQEPYRLLFENAYNATDLGLHYKMKLNLFMDPGNKAEKHPGSIIRFDETHADALKEYYSIAHPDNYFAERMLQTGKYFGYVENDNILAVSGVHVDSTKYYIAVLGNIATHPDHRGKGLSTMVTTHLVKELTGEAKTVCLNVKADNIPAVTCYQNLGFGKVHEFQDALFEKK